MLEFRAKLVQRVKRTSQIESFRFISSSRISFQPGQFVRVNFDEKDSKNMELNKYLSLSSSPTKEYIEITKKISNSEFSNRLLSLKIGEELFFNGPMGKCIFKKEYKKISFLIGGIGITPVISIIGYIVDNKIETDIALFYSNRTESDIAFKGELDQWREVNNNIKVFYIVTDYQPKDPTYIAGRIDKDLVINKVADINERISFIFGPPKMVEDMKTILLSCDCQQDNIKTESFIGY